MKSPRREAMGQAIIEHLQKIVQIGMPPAGYQLPRNELLERLQLAAAVCSPEVPGASGCSIAWAEGAICSVVSPAGRFEFELPATQEAAAWERVYTDVAGRATAHLVDAQPFLAIVDGSARDLRAAASGETR